MKKSAIKSQEAVNMKAGMVSISVDALRNTGRAFGGVKFRIGDEIVFPDWDDIDVFEDSFTSKDGKTRTFPVVKVAMNNIVRVVPVGSFRRETSGIDEYQERYYGMNPFLRSLEAAADDFDRIRMFAGHTVKVRELFEGRCIAFDKDTKDRIPYNKDDVKTFTTARWPVFEIVD